MAFLSLRFLLLFLLAVSPSSSSVPSVARRVTEAHAGKSKSEGKPESEEKTKAETEAESEAAEFEEGETELDDANEPGMSHLPYEHHVEDETTESVQLTVASMLFGFLAFDILLVYFVTYPDPQVQGEAYKMIATTVSIFMSVQMNQAIFTFFLKQLVKAPPPRGLGFGPPGHWHYIVVGVLLLAVFFTGISFFSYRWREDLEKLFAVRTIGGHLAAFAGISLFGHLQLKVTLVYGYGITGGIAVALLAMVTFPLLNILSAYIRKRIFAEEQGLVSDPVEEEEEPWVENLQEGEDEAYALVVSFCISQIIIMVVCGQMEHVQEAVTEHTLREVLLMSFWGVLSLFLLMAATWIRYHCESTHSESNSRFNRKRAAENVQNLMACVMSWCFLATSTWGLRLVIYMPELARITSAFCVTLVAIVCIVLLDRLADKFRDRKKALQEIGDDGEVEAMMESKDRVGILVDSGTHEKTLRTVINGVALLVGLTWDLAFEASNEVIVEGSSFSRKHPVICEIIIATMLAGIVMPAWLKHLVPKARMTDQEIEESSTLVNQVKKEWFTNMKRTFASKRR